MRSACTLELLNLARLRHPGPAGARERQGAPGSPMGAWEPKDEPTMTPNLKINYKPTFSINFQVWGNCWSIFCPWGSFGTFEPDPPGVPWPRGGLNRAPGTSRVPWGPKTVGRYDKQICLNRNPGNPILLSMWIGFLCKRNESIKASRNVSLPAQLDPAILDTRIYLT